MFCTECGSPVPEGTKFCGNCGERLSPRGGNAAPGSGADTAGQQAAGSPVAGAAQHPVAQYAQQAPAAPAMQYGQQMPPAQNAQYGQQAPAAPAMQYGQQPAAMAGGGAYAGAAAAPSPKKGAPVLAIVIGIIAIFVVAGILAAGMLTGWFGLAKGGPVYVMTEATYYRSGEAIERIGQYELDEHGNALRELETWYSLTMTEDDTVTSSELGGTTETDKVIDKNGHAEKRTITNRDKDESVLYEEIVKYSNEVSPDGLLLSTDYESWTEYPYSSSKEKTNVGKGAATFEYHPNGHVKSISSNHTIKVASWGDGNDYTSENTSTSEYDDHGFILHEEWTRSDDKDGEKTSTTVDYDWEFDSSGAPTAYTVTYTVSGKSAQIVEYKVETDNFGNIVAVFDEHGDKVAEFEYERVDDPSAYSRSFPSKPVYYSVTG